LQVGATRSEHSMRVKPFFVVFPVIVGVALYAYYAPKKKPEGPINITPKEYIELVEKRKEERLKQAAEEEKRAAAEAAAKQESTDTPAESGQ
jgi:hypothetical protein